MIKINPYLNFKGNTEEVFNFYKSVFGGEFTMLQRFKEIPEYEKLPENEKEMLMHVSLPIGENTLMGTDMLESMGQNLVAGNNFSLSIETDKKEEGDRIFNALADGGKIEMPLQQVFWGGNFGMVMDKFGVRWMISYP